MICLSTLKQTSVFKINYGDDEDDDEEDDDDDE